MRPAVLILFLFLGACAKVQGYNTAIEHGRRVALTANVRAMCQVPPRWVMDGVVAHGEQIMVAMYYMCEDYRRIMDMGARISQRHREFLGSLSGPQPSED